MRDVMLREEYEDGSARETLACGHVLYLTIGRPALAERRCLLCTRTKGQQRGKRPKRDRRA